MTWAHGARARLRLLARRAAESRIDQIRFHIDMETQRLVQPGRRLEGRGLWAANCSALVSGSSLTAPLHQSLARCA